MLIATMMIRIVIRYYETNLYAEFTITEDMVGDITASFIVKDLKQLQTHVVALMLTTVQQEQLVQHLSKY